MRYLGVLVVIALAQVFFSFNDLPDRVAIHFDGTGQPDGWAPRGAFVRFHLGAILAIALLFALIDSVIPRVPDRLINIPRKAHWLAPERRGATIASIRGFVVAIGVVIGLSVIVVNQLVARANLSDPVQMNQAAIFGLLVVLVAVVPALLIGFVALRFFRA